MFFSCAEVPAIISSPASYLSITGTILTGYANLNRLSFELDYVYNATTDVNELKVLLNIEQQEGANEDLNPPTEVDNSLLFDLQMLEPTLAGSSPQALIDSSSYDISTSIASAGDWSDVAQVANGGYAIGFTSSGTVRPYIEIPYAELADQPLADNFTIHFGIRLVAGGAFAGLTILSNNNLVSGNGFRIYTASAVGEEAQIWASLGALTAYGTSTDELRSGSGNRITTAWTYVTITYDGTTMRLYYNGTERVNTATLSGRSVTSTEPILVNRRNDSNVGHAGNWEIRRPMLFKRELTPAQVTELYDETLLLYAE
jgi:hypothetical protein